MTETTTRVIANAISNSGLTFMPSVSSSKNLSNPALAAGIGLLLSFFFRLIIYQPLLKQYALSLFYIINVASSSTRRETEHFTDNP